MRGLIIIALAVVISACTAESRTCRKMTSLCGVTEDECHVRVQAVRELAGDDGVEALAQCFSDASTCIDASGCAAGASVKQLGQAAGKFFDGVKKGLAK